jgi:predicted branched-subunit amino acid permease
VGGLLGGVFLGELEGLEFILTALFVVLTMDAYRASPDRTTVALTTGAAVVALLLAPGSMVLVAMSTFAVGLVVRHVVSTPAAQNPREPDRRRDQRPASTTEIGRA